MATGGTAVQGQIEATVALNVKEPNIIKRTAQRKATARCVPKRDTRLAVENAKSLKRRS